MSEHVFELSAQWQGDFKGSGNFTAGGLKYDVSIPTAFGGIGKGTNPEELLLAAAANCYMIMLNVNLQKQKLGFESIQLHSKAVFAIQGGALQMSTLTHQPKVLVAADTPAETIEKIKATFAKADETCMVSQLLHDKVKITIEGAVETV